MADRGGPSFVAGMLTGALIGAGLALVLAPWSGQDARDALRAKAREAANRAKDTVADISEQARSAVEAGKAAAAEQRAELEERHIETGHRE
jgi:gas vesicle protein